MLHRRLAASDTVSRAIGAWIAVGRHIGLASLAGVISGIAVGGILGRIVMRISGFAAGPNMIGVHTEGGNRVGDITFAGTVALIVFVGVGMGLAGGLVFAALEPWLRRLRPWHGLAYGVALLAAFGFTVLDPFNFDFARFGPLLLNLVMFSALFLMFGLLVAALFDRLKDLAASSGVIGRATRILAWIALGLALLVMVLAFVGAELDDQVFALVIAAALALAAVVQWRGLPKAIGYASLAVLLVLGTMRTLDGLQLFRGF